MQRPALQHDPNPASPPSPTLFPNDHVRLLVELLRPLGTELARRWLASLLIVDEADRESLVASIEKRVVETYGLGRDHPVTAPGPAIRDITVVGTPTQKSGFVERVDTTYAVSKPAKPATEPRRKRG